VRLFSHVSDFASGYMALPAMLILSDELTLWAPSGPELAYARGRGSPVTERALLDLVDAGRVRVFARDWWFDDRSRRENHAYPGGRWSKGLDQALATMRAQDDRLALSERRVATFGSEAGAAWADRQLAEGGDAVGRARRRMSGDSWRLPSGIRDKARRAPDERGRLWAVLRDVMNHQEALALSGAHLPVGPSRHAEAVPDIAGEPSPASRALEEAAISPERLVETLALIKALRRRRATSTRSFMRLLRSEDMTRVRRELSGFLVVDDQPVLTTLRGQVAAGMPSRDVRLPRMVARATRDSLGDRLALGYLGLALAAGLASAQSVVFSILGRFGGVLRGASVLPAPDYAGPVWPFFIEGRRARYRTIERLLEELDEMSLPKL
jgi:hypothetical protein